MGSAFLLTQFQRQLVRVLGFDGNEVDMVELEFFLREVCGDELGKDILNNIVSDISFFRSQDPASQDYSDAQIISVRRGVAAIAAHRIFTEVLRMVPESLYSLELIAKYVQKDTNIEIHPAATIGIPFAIDHGHGTVIGATTHVGERAFLYHGVTLGASGKKDTTGRRHPFLGNDVFCGNASQILGPSVIEDGVSIAAGAIVVNAYLEKSVRISLNIRVSGVIIPEGTTIYSEDPENASRYWAVTEGELVPAWKTFPKFLEYKGVTIV